jgi:hypothetical protein
MLYMYVFNLFEGFIMSIAQFAVLCCESTKLESGRNMNIVMRLSETTEGVWTGNWIY